MVHFGHTGRLIKHWRLILLAVCPNYRYDCYGALFNFPLSNNFVCWFCTKSVLTLRHTHIHINDETADHRRAKEKNILHFVSLETLSAYRCIGVKLAQCCFCFCFVLSCQRVLRASSICKTPQRVSAVTLRLNESSSDIITANTSTSSALVLLCVCVYFELLKQTVLFLASFYPCAVLFSACTQLHLSLIESTRALEQRKATTTTRPTTTTTTTTTVGIAYCPNVFSALHHQ